MAEMNGTATERQLTVRHRGRISQIGIYLGKFLRMFVYQSDWKVLPMAALIAGLVGFVMAGDFRVTMEGTITGSFAIVCVCIWNGAFNSIQVICRERDVIKREHRSGMHISSYVIAHMLYQFLLCLLQTVVTVLVMDLVGMKFPGPGLFTKWLILDAGITMFLVTYASDILSLWISSLVHSTTTAMTIMPFVLIFQLIFSGGLISLPGFVDPITMLTISCPGIKAMASLTKVNDLPFSTVSDMLYLLEDTEIEATVTIGQVLDALEDKDNPTIAQIRGLEIGNIMTVREVGEDILTQDEYEGLRNEPLIEDMTVGEVVEALMKADFMEEVLEKDVGFITTLGDAADYLAADEGVQAHRDESLTLHTTVSDLLDLVGKKETKEFIEKKASEASYDPDYEYSRKNVLGNWIHISIFVIVFFLLSVITLEFIDKDKR